MKTKTWLLVVLASAALLAAWTGCDKDDMTAPAPGGASSATAPVAGANSSNAGAPASRPSIAILEIRVEGQQDPGWKTYQFPSARLVVQQEKPAVDLLLFSDDPPDALSPKYAGHRFYLTLKADVDEPARLAQADVVLNAPTSERQESPDGIYLQGDRWVLQPFRAHIAFVDNGPLLNVIVEGQFQMFSVRDEQAAPKLAEVRGVLPVQVETLKKVASGQGR
jgi:hypothetical protein